MKFVAIIPARFASTRFPGKPLIEIHGKSMLQRVYEQAKKVKHIHEIIVATDNIDIYNHVQSFGYAIMTSEQHKSGTDRCFEAVNCLKNELNMVSDDVIINIQGDEPYIQPQQIEEVMSCFNLPSVQIATLAKKIDKSEELFNPNVVKVVFDKNHKALYFSRHPVPFARNLDEKEWLSGNDYYKHIGIYAYRFGVLGEITAIAPSHLECAESLEQLRWLECGYAIHLNITDFETIAIDTPEDLQRLLKILPH